MTDLFAEAFDLGLAKAEERSPNYPRATWDRSGRASKDAPNKRDEAWWRVNGPIMTTAWENWRRKENWKLAIFDGKPAVELALRFRLGREEWLGYIDRVFEFPNGDLCILDIKTGVMVPSSTGQLGLYACALEEMYGVRPVWGCFWFPDKGIVGLESLERWSRNVLDKMGSDTAFAIENEVFVPHPSMLCGSCSVRDYCFVKGGENAYGHDPLAMLHTLPQHTGGQA